MNDIKTVIAEYSEQFNRRLPDFFPCLTALKNASSKR